MIPVQHSDASRGPRNTPAHIDEKTGDVLDVAGNRIGKSEPLERETLRMMNADADGKRLLDLRPSDVNSGKGYGIYSPSQDTEALDDAVADIVCPVEFVTQQLGTRYYEDPLSATKQVVPTGIEGGAHVPTTQMVPVKVAYDCQAYGLAVDVPAGVAANSDFDVVKGSAYRLALALKLAREVRVASLMLAAGTWASASQRVLGAAFKWNGGATLDPIADLFFIMNASSLPVTHFVMSESVLQYIFTSTAATITRAQNFFMPFESFMSQNGGARFPKFIVSNMKQFSGGSASYIWGSSTAANVVAVRSTGIAEALSTARTFRYVGAAQDGAQTSDSGFLLRKYWVARHGGRGSTGIVLVSNDSEKIINNTVGGIITGAIQ